MCPEEDVGWNVATGAGREGPFDGPATVPRTSPGCDAGERGGPTTDGEPRWYCGGVSTSYAARASCSNSSEQATERNFRRVFSIASENENSRSRNLQQKNRAAHFLNSRFSR